MSSSSLSDLDIRATIPSTGCHPSPRAWEDQVLYFLLVDRFSDGKEKGYRDLDNVVVGSGTTPAFRPVDAGNAVQSEAEAAVWRDAGGKYAGGTLRGLRSKLGYLKRLGVTALWVSPVLKQVSFAETYHGYGTQDFLEVNPKFGTSQDLRDLVREAHRIGIYVILDIIVNHVGNVFGYDPARNPNYQDKDGRFDPRWDGGLYPVLGFHDEAGRPTVPFRPADAAKPVDRDQAIWPVEFQDPACYTAKGRISNFDHDPEYLDGDFFDLKDVHHGSGEIDRYMPSPALEGLCQVYKYWMAFADLDGFRIDTVKHLDPGATRFLASSLREFAQSIGKDKFLLLGEITGGRSFAFDLLEVTGLDAALGIDDIPDKLEFLAKGLRNPTEYFDLFRNSELVGKGSHTWFRNRVVTLFNDHDQVSKGERKARFCADAGVAELLVPALALNLLTLGIPCLYYGTEQGFDGAGSGDGADRYIRESMFGGNFGAFRSRGVHFFNESNPVYKYIAEIADLRSRLIALRRGRQYLRPISGDGMHFGIPTMMGGEIRSVVPWSRILSDSEVLCAINTHPSESRGAWVTIDATLHRPGDRLECEFSTDAGRIGTEVVAEARNGLSVFLTLPAASFAVYS